MQNMHRKGQSTLRCIFSFPDLRHHAEVSLRDADRLRFTDTMVSTLHFEPDGPLRFFDLCRNSMLFRLTKLLFCDIL